MQEINWPFNLPLYKTEGGREKRKGLLGKKDFHFALLLPRCPLVHTFFMKEEIDVIFLRKNKVRAVYRSVSKNRFCGAFALTCIEMPAGMASSLDISKGDIIDIS